MSTHRILASLLVLAGISSLAWAKEDILPTKKGKSRDERAADNALYNVADDMDVVSRRLNEAKTGDTTQETQQVIIEKLDHLIEEAAKQCEKQSQGGDAQKRQPKPKPEQQPKPSSDEERKKQQEEAEKKPAASQEQKKTERPGIGRPGQGDPTGPLHTDAEEWGNLPPAIRDQLLQTQGEGFPLKYRELLRRYYLELSKPRE